MTTDSAPKSTLPYPPLYKDAQFVVLSDWDGTITNFDSNDYLTDNLGFGQQKRRDLNIEILEGRLTFRDGFRYMLESVPTPFDECVDVLKESEYVRSPLILDSRSFSNGARTTASRLSLCRAEWRH